MSYNIVADSFRIKKLCRRVSSSEVWFYPQNGRFAFLSPLWGLRGSVYGDHLRLIGKRVVDFLLVLTELLSLGVRDEAIRAIIGWKSAISLQQGTVDQQLQVEGVTPTNHSSSQKTRLNDLSYGVTTWTDFSFVLLQSTRLTDGQTDRILIARPRLHSMQHGKNIHKPNWLISYKIQS